MGDRLVARHAHRADEGGRNVEAERKGLGRSCHSGSGAKLAGKGIWLLTAPACYGKARPFRGKAGLRLAHPFSSLRSEEHTSELQSLMRISYAVFCLKKKITTQHTIHYKIKQ